MNRFLSTLTAFVLITAFLSLTAFLFDVDPRCNKGHACAKCPCGGDYFSQLEPWEPDNPDNPQYPRFRCTQYCKRECCLCKKPEKDATR